MSFFEHAQTETLTTKVQMPQIGTPQSKSYSCGNEQEDRWVLFLMGYIILKASFKVY